jgi:hypothetical protein
MAKLNRSTTIGFLVFSVLVLAANSWAQSRPPIIERIAKTLLFVMCAGPTIRHNFSTNRQSGGV